MCQLRCVSVKMCLLRSAHLDSKDRSQLTDVIKESSSFLCYLQSGPFQKPCWSEAGCPWQSELCSEFLFFTCRGKRMASCGFLLRLRTSFPRITQEISCVSLAHGGLDCSPSLNQPLRRRGWNCLYCLNGPFPERR